MGPSFASLAPSSGLLLLLHLCLAWAACVASSPDTLLSLGVYRSWPLCPRPSCFREESGCLAGPRSGAVGWTASGTLAVWWGSVSSLSCARHFDKHLGASQGSCLRPFAASRRGEHAPLPAVPDHSAPPAGPGGPGALVRQRGEQRAAHVAGRAERTKQVIPQGGGTRTQLRGGEGDAESPVTWPSAATVAWLPGAVRGL